MAVTTFTNITKAQTNDIANRNVVANPLPKADSVINQWKEQDFISFDPHYKEALATRVARLRTLSAQVIAREIAGQYTRHSHQVLSELIGLLSSSADFKRMDKRLDDLKASLDDVEERGPEEQDSTDGSWGSKLILKEKNFWKWTKMKKPD